MRQLGGPSNPLADSEEEDDDESEEEETRPLEELLATFGTGTHRIQ